MDKLVQPWYAEWIETIMMDNGGDSTLFLEVMTAANFLDVEPMLDLTCVAMSLNIKSKSRDERVLFVVALPSLEIST